MGSSGLVTEYIPNTVTLTVDIGEIIQSKIEMLENDRETSCVCQ